MATPRRSAVLAVFALVAAALLVQAQTPPMTPDIPPSFTAPQIGYDFTQRVAMIPMRDGVRLYTVIAVPKGVTHAPIVLTRTPYNAAARLHTGATPYLAAQMMVGDRKSVV